MLPVVRKPPPRFVVAASCTRFAHPSLSTIPAIGTEYSRALMCVDHPQLAPVYGASDHAFNVTTKSPLVLHTVSSVAPQLCIGLTPGIAGPHTPPYGTEFAPGMMMYCNGPPFGFAAPS